MRQEEDEYRGVEGTLTLALENAQGEQVAAQNTKFKIDPLGQKTIYNNFKFPQITGEFLLRAIIQYSENGKDASTQNLRQVKLVKLKEDR